MYQQTANYIFLMISANTVWHVMHVPKIVFGENRGRVTLHVSQYAHYNHNATRESLPFCEQHVYITALSLHLQLHSRHSHCKAIYHYITLSLKYIALFPSFHQFKFFIVCKMQKRSKLESEKVWECGNNDILLVNQRCPLHNQRVIVCNPRSQFT